MGTKILAVDDSAISLKLLTSTLTQAGYEAIPATNGTEALKLADEAHPDMVILDVMMPDMDGYEVCRRLRRNRNTARLPIMMLTAQDSLEEKVKGFDAGADDYMIKPFQPPELQARIAVLLRRAAPQMQAPVAEPVEGKSIAVFSLRGGVGVSTFAANLAVGLTQLWGSPAVLVDLALTAGHAALMFNLSPRTTWADLAQSAIEDIDAEFLNQVLLSHSSGTRVLAAPRRAEQGELLTVDKIAQVLSVLRHNYQYVVIDLPHDFHDTTLAGLDHADEILLMLAPELASVVNTSTTLELFETLEYPKDKVRLALNYSIEKPGLARNAIEEALRRPMNVIMPFASEAMTTAINQGKPPVFDKPSDQIGALFEDLAFFSSQDEQRNARPKNPTQAWNRVATRLQQRKKK
ncbi:MAG: response regulator [Chloroflexi bacterium]|nr:response regulator [Chloroflexota bacterium]